MIQTIQTNQDQTLFPGNLPRLACDPDLFKLAQWLRAAGYDTYASVYEQSVSEMLAHVCDESRLLITRDEGLYRFRHMSCDMLVINSSDLTSQVEEVSEALGINWLYQPFSRCIVCNTELEDHKFNVAASLSHSIVEPLMNNCEPAKVCHQCDRVFWPGSHNDQMLSCLTQFANSEYFLK